MIEPDERGRLAAGGNPDPEEGWESVLPALARLQPADPDPAASSRVWEQIARGMVGLSKPGVAGRLLEVDPGEPPAGVLARIWERVAQALRPRLLQGSSRMLWAWRFAAAASALVLVLFLGAATSAAAAALPGTQFYPWKRVGEHVRWEFTFSEEGRASLALELAERRLGEVKSLAGIGAPAELVLHTLNDSLSFLGHAVTLGSSSEAAQRAVGWWEDAEGWPVAYRGAARSVLEAWLKTGSSPSPGGNPTPAGPAESPLSSGNTETTDSSSPSETSQPPGESSPTGPTSPIESTLPPATGTPTVPPLPTQTVELPTPTVPPLPTETAGPTEPLPTATTTSTGTEAPSETPAPSQTPQLTETSAGPEVTLTPAPVDTEVTPSPTEPPQDS